MAENEAPQGAEEVSSEVEPQNDVPKETDWKAEARKWESRAKDNLSVAKANEDAAKRLAEIEESNKTAEQKQADRLAEIERENAELKSAKLRAEVANSKGLPVEVIAGPESASPEALEAYADLLISHFKAAESSRFVVPNEGKTPSNSGADEGMREVARGLFGA